MDKKKVHTNIYSINNFENFNKEVFRKIYLDILLGSSKSKTELQGKSVGPLSFMPRAVTTIEADEAAASSDFLKKKNEREREKCTISISALSKGYIPGADSRKGVPGVRPPP